MRACAVMSLVVSSHYVYTGGRPVSCRFGTVVASSALVDCTQMVHSCTPEVAAPPWTPTKSQNGSTCSPLRRSPRSPKVAGIPYYQPLCEQPVNIGRQGASGSAPIPRSSSPKLAGRSRTPTNAFHYPPLPSRVQGAMKEPCSPLRASQRSGPARAASLQQPRGGCNRDQAAVQEGGTAQHDEVEVPVDASEPCSKSMRQSNSRPSPSQSNCVSASEPTGGRVKRVTAAAAMLRIQGKMKPPSIEFKNLSSKHALAAVSAAVSAVKTTSLHNSPGSKADVSHATSGLSTLPVRKPSTRARVQHSKATKQASSSSSGRKRRLVAIDESACNEPARKRLTSQKGTARRQQQQHVHEEGLPEQPQASSQHDSGRSQQAKQRGPSAAKVGSSASKGKVGKGRKAKELVQAVVKGSQLSAAAVAQAPQRGRAAVKLKQENARAEAAKGKLVPAAVPAMQTSAAAGCSTGGGERQASRSCCALDCTFPTGAAPWSDVEVVQLHDVCTHKVQPNSMRYWEQVALHMPGRTITECYEKFNEKHAAPKQRPRVAAALLRAPAAVKGLGGAEVKTEVQKRKYARLVRWRLQQSQQNDPERLKEQMRQQKAADACMDALRRKRPNRKPQPIVGTISKPPPAFPVFSGLEDDVPEGTVDTGSNKTPETQAKPRQQKTPEPDISEALEIMKQAREQLLESPDADFYFSDGLSD